MFYVKVKLNENEARGEKSLFRLLDEMRRRDDGEFGECFDGICGELVRCLKRMDW
jgi:hypothetical protein